MSRFFAIILLSIFFAIPPQITAADEIRPSYLDMRELAADRFAIVWKTPTLGELRLRLRVILPERCTNVGETISSTRDDAAYERWTAHCPGGLKGQSIEIGGLRTITTDVLVRVASQDGSAQLTRLTPTSSSFVVRGSQTTLELAQTYFILGVDHILTSLDHLLFVLALMLLIGNGWALLKTITAFTVAHSITLAGAALGYLSLPQRPVEAVIALSIVFLAGEVVKMHRTPASTPQTSPWIVAFGFGLLHGFGFAGALKEIGLPQTDVPLALVVFNLGIEVGQLLFVLTLLLLAHAFVRLYSVPASPARQAIGYGIGLVSAVWLIERLVSFTA